MSVMDHFHTKIKYWEYMPQAYMLFFIAEIEMNDIDDLNVYFSSALDVSTCNTTIDVKQLNDALYQLDCTITYESQDQLDSFSLNIIHSLITEKQVLNIVELNKGYSPRQSDLISYVCHSESEETTQYWVGNDRIAETISRPLTFAEKHQSLEYHDSAPPFTQNSILNDIEDVSDQRIMVYKDKFKGKKAWLIGNGKSVRKEDLELLRDEVTFGFNRIHLAYDDMDFRPTYLVSGDQQVINDFGNEIVSNNKHVFFAQDVPCDIKEAIWLRQINMSPPLFSLNPEYYVTPGGSSVYVAMQLAYYMGFESLYFYGADFSFDYEITNNPLVTTEKAMGDGNHFIENYRNNKKWVPPYYRSIARSFLNAKCMFNNRGGEITNVTYGGKLHIFPRMEFTNSISQ